MQLVTIIPDNKLVVVIPKHLSLGDKTGNNNNWTYKLVPVIRKAQMNDEALRS